MGKQTAVEWLINQVEDYIGLIPTDIIKQAKEMEKQQIIDAANTLLYPGPGPGDNWAEQYYNKTFKNK
jgi:hypothetical protein